LADREIMSEWDKEIKHFLIYWFSGFVNGLESIDEKAREVLLRACGKACARSYTAAVFQEAKEQSADMASFLDALAVRFPEARYEQLTPTTIRVRYTHCACDLVTCGLVESPLLCGCSAENLRENFRSALGTGATVTLESSILGGADECAFLVSLAGTESDPWAVTP
jgi:hypothetical protein